MNPYNCRWNPGGIFSLRRCWDGGTSWNPASPVRWVRRETWGIRYPKKSYITLMIRHFLFREQVIMIQRGIVERVQKLYDLNVSEEYDGRKCQYGNEASCISASGEVSRNLFEHVEFSNSVGKGMLGYFFFAHGFNFIIKIDKVQRVIQILCLGKKLDWFGLICCFEILGFKVREK